MESTLSTGQVIESLLKENTGRVLVDSGGAYGRAWERNQTREFDAEPAVVARAETRVYQGEPSTEIFLSFNTKQWLESRDGFAYDHDLTVFFHQVYARLHDPQDQKYWLDLMQEFPKFVDWYASDAEHERVVLDECQRVGLNWEYLPTLKEWYFGSGPFYSYNWSPMHDQDIQFVVYQINGQCVVFLQTHNGCDARWGLSRPLAFRISDAAYLLDGTRAYCDCPDCGAMWETEDSGYRWRYEGSRYHSRILEQVSAQLEDYPVRPASDLEPEELEALEARLGLPLEQLEMTPLFGEVEKVIPMVGFILQDDRNPSPAFPQGRLHCPFCGGELSFWWC